MGALYRISFPDGKQYIGITSKTAQQRFDVHWRARWKLDRPVSLVLREHGRCGASLETLVIAADMAYLGDLEKKAIALFGTKWPNGLNRSSGGVFPSDHTPEIRKKLKGTATSDEARANMSKAKKGVKFSDEARSNIRAGLIGNKYCLGKKFSADRKARQSAGMLKPGLPPQKNGASGHRGVSFDPLNKRWRAHITISGQMQTLGRFDDILQAVAARRAAELAHEKKRGLA